MGSAKSAAGVVLGTVGAASLANKLTGGSAKSGHDRPKLPQLVIEPVPIVKQEEIQEPVPILFEKVFHDLPQSEIQRIRETVNEYKRIIRAKAEYPLMLAVTKKHEEYVRAQCSERGVLPESGIGVVFIENGGGEDKISDKDARGVAQLMPDTARQYGMRVDYGWKSGGPDERGNPQKSLQVMGMYLRDNKELFAGDEGLAIWSYHAGAGNVMSALREYFINNLGVDIGDWGHAIEIDSGRQARQIKAKVKDLIASHKVNVHQVLEDRAVKAKVVSSLDDFTETYVYQAVAAAELFDESAKIEKFTS